MILVKHVFVLVFPVFISKFRACGELLVKILQKQNKLYIRSTVKLS